MNLARAWSLVGTHGRAIVGKEQAGREAQGLRRKGWSSVATDPNIVVSMSRLLPLDKGPGPLAPAQRQGGEASPVSGHPLATSLHGTGWFCQWSERLQ